MEGGELGRGSGNDEALKMSTVIRNRFVPPCATKRGQRCVRTRRGGSFERGDHKHTLTSIQNKQSWARIVKVANAEGIEVYTVNNERHCLCL